jgi:hypothetical protein
VLRGAQLVGPVGGGGAPPPDAAGETSALVPVGRVEVWVPGPRSPDQPGRVDRVVLGTFEFVPGERKGTVELVLPADPGG